MARIIKNEGIEIPFGFYLDLFRSLTKGKDGRHSLLTDTDDRDFKKGDAFYYIGKLCRETVLVRGDTIINIKGSCKIPSEQTCLINTTALKRCVTSLKVMQLPLRSMNGTCFIQCVGK